MFSVLYFVHERSEEGIRGLLYERFQQHIEKFIIRKSFKHRTKIKREKLTHNQHLCIRYQNKKMKNIAMSFIT